MADPYGYPETLPSEAASASAYTIWLATASAIATMMGPCTCYAGNLLALPLALGAIYQFMQGQGGTPSADRRASDTAGLVLAIVSGGISAMFALAFVMIMTMYGLIFIGALAGEL